ncbi:hypothetical protein AgCh_000979 [Apium graveolens]
MVIALLCKSEMTLADETFEMLLDKSLSTQTICRTAFHRPPELRSPTCLLLPQHLVQSHPEKFDMLPNAPNMEILQYCAKRCLEGGVYILDGDETVPTFSTSYFA